ncbi:restriction endonuclease PLD domain-containing protein [Microbacterium lacticum]|uniref:NgoFVII restriction endonuclease n=1 Tax=Microbacterium lacticum TaxID=33885 RepID=A0A4Y3UKE3_9MICO|nr:restriction endonuclease PLD domain-containing protein [Microbacterium lacticum]TQN00751.1 NgoFVII restriction endonuclease [Microbacterium lacticum]GEB94167.1 NgoFVII family restriction endonuclease [Microbacterium lacticum]GGN13827.1 NgoFVII family restriction endonuclease [Microbacterium lacticum]
MFLSKDLFETVLTRYIERGADELRIVSGYASAEMCTRLLLAAKKMHKGLKIRLIVGMTGYEGITVDTHQGLLSVQAEPPEDSGSVSVSYVTNGISVHSKLFIWMQGNQPLGAWIGSANFTQNGFGVGFRGSLHKEIMTTTDIETALAYYAAIEGVSIAIDHPDVENEITIHNRPLSTAVSVASSEGDVEPDYMSAESVVLPLVALTSNSRTGTQRGKVHAKSGLNWGQRPEYQREPNQAYIPVPAEVRRMGFFPPLGVVFRVTTTDNKLFLMKLAQEEGKALETPQNNSFIGEYFRMRLGVANGEPVVQDDVLEFGSRFVAFYRIDEGDEEPSYIMDYSPEYEERGADTYRL